MLVILAEVASTLQTTTKRMKSRRCVAVHLQLLVAASLRPHALAKVPKDNQQWRSKH